MKRNLFYVWHVKANWAKHQNVHCEEKRAEKKRAESMWEKHAQNKPLIFSNWKTLDLKFMLFFLQKAKIWFPALIRIIHLKNSNRTKSKHANNWGRISCREKNPTWALERRSRYDSWPNLSSPSKQQKQKEKKIGSSLFIPFVLKMLFCWFFFLRERFADSCGTESRTVLNFCWVKTSAIFQHEETESWTKNTRKRIWNKGKNNLKILLGWA